jgi:hypothetical protein
MKHYSIPLRLSRLVRWTAASLAVGVLLGARLLAADAPADAAAAPATPATPPAGTWYVFSPPKEGEVVSSVMRVKLLTVANSFTERDHPDLLTRLTATDDPFYLKLPPPPTPVAGGTSAANAAPPPPKLTDEDKLKQVADAVMPTGLIETASVRLVTFAHRDAVEVGQSFPVPFPNDPAPSVIQVIDANDTSCLLKLGNTTFSADFVSNTSASPAPRPAAPSTSETK